MKLDSAVFYTNDLEKVITFYKESLGFTVNYIQEGRFASFIFDNGAKLGIKQAIEEREVPGSQTAFIEVNNIEDLYEKLKTKIEIYKELVDQDWAINFSVLDPDGNKIQFAQYK